MDLLTLYLEAIAADCCTKCGGVVVRRSTPERVFALLDNVPLCFCRKGGPSLVERSGHHCRKTGHPPFRFEPPLPFDL